MAKSKKIVAALKLGAAQATAILKQRDQALQNRRAALLKLLPDSPLQATAFAPAIVGVALPRKARAFVEAFGQLPSAGIVVAEGDSWFDYPGTDVLKQLADNHGYTVASVAHRGDRVEDMAYGSGQLDDLVRQLENVLLTHQQLPVAILLSGGGNDLAGDDFHMLLNYATAQPAGLNDTIVRGLIEERLKVAYVTVLKRITELCKARTGLALPIIVHGYDYAVPDGRGFWGGWWFLPGPWLQPGFQQKAYADLTANKVLVRQLIDAFNTMLAEVAAMPEFAHVRYLDLRGTLSSGDDFKDWWDNELHPTPKGFERVADRFAALLVQAV